jgi:hypothetical protein
VCVGWCVSVSKQILQLYVDERTQKKIEFMTLTTSACTAKVTETSFTNSESESSICMRGD